MQKNSETDRPGEVTITVGQVIIFERQPTKKFLIADTGIGNTFTTVPIIEGRSGDYLQGVGSTHPITEKYEVVGALKVHDIKKAMEAFFRESLDITEGPLPDTLQEAVLEQVAYYEQSLGRSKTVVVD